MISIQRVAATRAVQVFGINDSTSNFILTLFFELQFGSISEIKITDYPRCRIIEFKNHEGMY